MPRFDIEDAFQKIGRVSDVWVARKPPGFAFIEMEVNNFCINQTQPSLQNYYNIIVTIITMLWLQDKRDAEDACRELDGTRICGNRVKVGQII